MADPFDREKFNTDPKYEKERSQFDSMVEDSLKRFKEKSDANNSGKDANFFDWLFGGVK